MYTDRQPLILGVSIFGLTLVTLAVGLRFLARIRYGNGLWWDDWVNLMALPFCIAISVLSIEALRFGYGLQLDEMTLSEFAPLLKSFYASGLIYQNALGLIKASVLLFYRRIFPTRHVIVGCWVLGLLDAAWTIGTDISWIVQCSPIESLWNLAIPGKCMDRQKYIMGIGVPNVVIDVGVFLLPVYSVWQLQMPASRKLAVTGVFGVALFAVLCSIIRLVFATAEFRTDDLYSWVIGLMWSLAEMDVALFCSCLPALKPLISCSFARAKGSSGGVPSAGLRAERVKAKRYDGETLTGSESSGTSKDDMTHYSKKDDGFSEDMELTKSVRHVAEPEKAQFRRESSIGQNKGRADNSGLTLGTDGIRVQKTFEVVAKEMV